MMASNQTLRNETNLPPAVNPSLHVGYVELCYFLIGSPTNFLVLFICYHMLGKNRNQYIVMSMTVADTMFTLLHCPLMFLFLVHGVHFDFSCIVMYVATYTGAIASSLSLVLLNVDKFVYIHRPLHHGIIVTKGRVLTGILCAWIISIIMACVILFGPATDHPTYCYYRPKHISLYVAFLVLFQVVPVLVSLTTSLYIAAVVLKTLRRNRERKTRWEMGLKPDAACLMDLGSHDNHTGSRSHRFFNKASTIRGKTNPSKSTRSILFVFCSTMWSTVTCLPYRITYIIIHLRQDLTAKLGVAPWVFFCLMALYPIGNSLITIVTQRNYVIYLNRKFRRLLRLPPGQFPENSTVKGQQTTIRTVMRGDSRSYIPVSGSGRERIRTGHILNEQTVC